MFNVRINHSRLLKKNIMADLLELILITVHDSNSQDELLRIVVIENAVQVISKTLKKNPI